MFARIVCVSFSVWRFACALVLFAADAGGVVVAFACVEILMAVMSGVNAWIASEVDATPRGLIPPMIYTAGLYVSPEGQLLPSLELALWGIVAFRLWTLISLGCSVTCGLTTFVAIKTWGPYSIVRHPMQLSGILARCVFCLSWYSAANLSGLVLMTFGSVLIVLAEESFLRKFDGWKDYTLEVPDRLFPGIW